MKNKENDIRSKAAYPQGSLVCSVCGKEFKANDDTRYIIAGGYTCSWKCFLTESKKRDDEKSGEDKDKKRRKK